MVSRRRSGWGGLEGPSRELAAELDWRVWCGGGQGCGTKRQKLLSLGFWAVGVGVWPPSRHRGGLL